MAIKWPNWLKQTYRWLVRLLTLQAFWKKPGPNDSMKYMSPSYGEHSRHVIDYQFNHKTGSSATAPMTVIQGYETPPTDPMKIATEYASYMNREANHCENFHEFVCGKFPSTNPRPPWYDAVAASDYRVHEMNKKILVYLEAQRLQGPPIFQKIRAFYSSCMNEVALEANGLPTIFTELSSVGLSPDPMFAYKVNFWTYKYIDTLAKIHRSIPLVEFLFDVSVQVDPKKMQINNVFFGNTPATTHASANVATEGLYSFAKFSNVFNAKIPTEPDGLRYQAVRAALKAYISKVVSYMETQTQQVGKTRSSSQFFTEGIEEVTNFLLDLEKTRQTGKYNRVENILRTKVWKMQDEVKFLDKHECVEITWTKYFEMLFAGLYGPKGGYFTKQDPDILVQNVHQLKETFRIFYKTKMETFVLTMWFVVVHSLAPLGPKILQDYRNEYLRVVYGVQPTPRKLTCLNLVRTHFGYFVGHVLAQDKRSDREQMKVIEMVNNIKLSLSEAIQQSTWIDPATKSGAQTKLDSVTPYISVWETLKDPNKLQQFYGNTFEIGLSFQATYLNMLRQRRTEMLQTLFIRNDYQRKPYPNPASIHPRYYPSFVHLTVPVGALGPPFYDLGHEAFNYGALGVLITRELWHAVDASGRNFDQHGNGYVWWMAPTFQEYGKREATLIQFYGAIRLQTLGINVDGAHTAIENIADLVGLEVGLRAYHRHIQMHGGPEKNLDALKEFDHEKLFTIAFASMHCIHSTLEYTYGQVTEDEYPPQAVRVNGVTMNSKEFARIWNCPPKQTIIL